MEIESPTDGFAELTLETDDLSGLERFYVDVFGLRVLAREPDRVWARRRHQGPPRAMVTG